MSEFKNVNKYEYYIKKVTKLSWRHYLFYSIFFYFDNMWVGKIYKMYVYGDSSAAFWSTN